MPAVPKPAPREKKPPKPIRSKNVQRSADEFVRCYGSDERVDYIADLPCVACGIMRHNDNAHIEGGGTSRKADANKIVPLCRPHHAELHRVGREEFEGNHLLDLAALALDTERCWRRFAGHAAAQEKP